MKNINIGYMPALNYACEESLNTLCTNLSFSGPDLKSIMLTSCRSGEGKSFLAMHICRIMAGLGKNVVLVDCDLRRSNVVKDFHLHFTDSEHPAGLTHLLAGMAQEEEVLYATNLPGLYIVPMLRTVSNSLPLLNSPRLGQLIQHLSSAFDYVIVDAPPIGALIDAAQIAKSCDGTVMVVLYNQIRKKELLSCYDQLKQSKCQILGAVLNQVEFNTYNNRRYYYNSYYYYKKGYGKYYGKYAKYGKYSRYGYGYGPDSGAKTDSLSDSNQNNKEAAKK